VALGELEGIVDLRESDLVKRVARSVPFEVRQITVYDEEGRVCVCGSPTIPMRVSNILVRVCKSGMTIGVYGDIREGNCLVCQDGVIVVYKRSGETTRYCMKCGSPIPGGEASLKWL